MRFESWCGPEHSGREKDLRMQVWTSIHGSEKDLQTKKRTRTVRNSAPTRNPSPAPPTPCFAEPFVAVPLRSSAITEPLEALEKKGAKEQTTQALGLTPVSDFVTPESILFKRRCLTR